jgi:MFS family permease
MSFKKSGFVRIWRLYSAQEKRNIGIYIIGIMLYKFGLEAFNGSIITLATNRYDQEAFHSNTTVRTFERVGLLSGLNQAFQCLGSILIAPLTRRWPTRTVLSISVFVFALFSAILMIVDVSTGGRIKPSNFVQLNEHDYSYYGKYNTNGIIPIYCITGIAFGMVELIRRVIPRDIVGDNAEKLQKMDALVHIFYEIAGVSGAFATGLGLIPRLGNNYSFMITPMLFTAAAFVWFFISSLGSITDPVNDDLPPISESNYLKSIVNGTILFVKSFFIGAKIIFTHRKFAWLWSCYALTLYAHRYLENGIAPQIGKRYLQQSEWSQIIVGASNFGELLGACFIFIFGNFIKTPLPWSRLDASILFLVWYIPFYYPPANNVTYAWIIAATYIPVGFGSAADDIALNSFIQSSLSGLESKHKDISTLGAVASFLYSSYIIIYAILNPLLGLYLDKVFNDTGSVRPAFIYTVAIQMTVIAVIVLISTLIPKGAISCNPTLIQDEDLDTMENPDILPNQKESTTQLVTYF